MADKVFLTAVVAWASLGVVVLSSIHPISFAVTVGLLIYWLSQEIRDHNKAA